MPDNQSNPSGDTQQSQETNAARDSETVAPGTKSATPQDHSANNKQKTPDGLPKHSFYLRIISGTRDWWSDPYRNRPNIAEKITVGLTIVIALIGLLQWKVYRQQAAIMGSDNPQTKKLIEAANIQAEAAKKSATAAADFATSAEQIKTTMDEAVAKLDAQVQASDTARQAADKSSRDALQATIDDFKQEQRAWLGVTEANGIPKDVGPYDIKIPIQNTGRTPAVGIDMYFRTKFVLVHGASVDIEQFPGPPQALGNISPGATRTFLYHQVIGLAGVIASHPDGYFAIYGGITYRDVSGSEHWMTYCYLVYEEGKYNFCPVGNDIGEGFPSSLRKAS